MGYQDGSLVRGHTLLVFFTKQSDFLDAGTFETILSLHQAVFKCNKSLGDYRECKFDFVICF